MVLDTETRTRLCCARDLLELADCAPSIPLVARRAGFSPFHFIRLFRATFGLTPHQYRVAARLERARRLLAARVSVTDVCMRTGWTSVGTFSALFARRVGEAPSRYQRRVSRLVQVPADLERTLMPGCFSLLAALSPGAFRNFEEA